MIEWLKNWTNQIIVASIIAIILEMIIPEGNNKKYIKIIIGIYILFTIINPVVSGFTGNNINIENLEIEKYLSTDETKTVTSTQEFENNNSKLIKQAYIENIKTDIKTKLKQKGYEVEDIKLNVEFNEDLESYGTICNIELILNKEKEQKIKENNIVVNEVNININNEKNIQSDKKSITENEKQLIIEYLSSEYSVNKEDIIIN